MFLVKDGDNRTVTCVFVYSKYTVVAWYRQYWSRNQILMHVAHRISLIIAEVYDIEWLVLL